MKTFIISFLLLFFVISIHAQQDSIGFYLQKAREASTNDDLQNFYFYAETCYNLNPSCMIFIYNYAIANALKKNIEKTVFILERLLSNGVNSDILNNSLFDFVRSNEKYQNLAELYSNSPAKIINSELAFEIPEKDIIPEGITYNPVTKEFFVGSLFKSKIVKIDADKNVSDFIKTGQYDFLSVLGMNADPERNILWANSCYGYLKESIPAEKLGMAGIYKLNLTDGTLIKHYTLLQEENHFLNDLAINNNGDVFITDSHVPAVYKIDSKTDELNKMVDLPFNSYPNGITISDNDKKLFIATSFGIYMFDFNSKEILLVPLAENQVYASCDGLYYYKNSLIGVQSFTNRVTRFYLNENQNRITHQQILESNNPLFETPTTGVIVDNKLYLIANAQLTKVDDKGKIAPLDELNTTKIIAIKIED